MRPNRPIAIRRNNNRRHVRQPPPPLPPLCQPHFRTTARIRCSTKRCRTIRRRLRRQPTETLATGKNRKPRVFPRNTARNACRVVIHRMVCERGVYKRNVSVYYCARCEQFSAMFFVCYICIPIRRSDNERCDVDKWQTAHLGRCAFVLIRSVSG